MSGGTRSGRHAAGRIEAASAYCYGCGIRRTIGEPRSVDSWAHELRIRPLTPEQVDLLLVAAREYRTLSIEAEEPMDSVAFVDWISPDALGVQARYVEFDGARSRTEDGGPTHRYKHREPFPLPTVQLPPKIRGAA